MRKCALIQCIFLWPFNWLNCSQQVKNSLLAVVFCTRPRLTNEHRAFEKGEWARTERGQMSQSGSRWRSALRAHDSIDQKRERTREKKEFAFESVRPFVSCWGGVEQLQNNKERSRRNLLSADMVDDWVIKTMYATKRRRKNPKMWVCICFIRILQLYLDKIPTPKAFKPIYINS